MSKINDFIRYKDKFGLVQFNYAPPGEYAKTSDNGAIMTVEYALILNTLERAIEIGQLKTALGKLEVETKNGFVTQRYPGSTAIDSMDNATALIVFSELFDDSRLSKKLYMHGEITRATALDQLQDRHRNLQYYPIAWLLNGLKAPRRFYSIRPNDWSLQSWWGRSPGFMGMLELAATGKTSLLRKTALLVGQFMTAFEERGSTSNKKLSYMVWQWLKKRHWTWMFFYKIWKVIMGLKHKDGMVDVYRIYYGPDHPLTKHSPKFL